MENKQIAFLNFAKTKKWDASLCVWNGKFIAILNPVNRKEVFQGESEVSIDEAMELCKKEVLKKK